MRKLICGFLFSFIILSCAGESQAGPTLDALTYNNFSGKVENNQFYAFRSFPDGFQLSDGTIGETGAGGLQYSGLGLNHFERDGDYINYFLNDPTTFLGFPSDKHFMLWQGLNYQGNYLGHFGITITSAGPFFLRAKYGTADATLNGFVGTAPVDPAYAGRPSDFVPTSGYNAIVPVTFNFSLFDNSTWDENAFSHDSSFIVNGKIDFASSVTVTPEPASAALLLIGAAFMLLVYRRERQIRCVANN